MFKRTYETKEVLVAHLINPPLTSELRGDNPGEGSPDDYEDKTSHLPAPVCNVTVSVAIPQGKTADAAWALTAEPLQTGDDARTQAVPLDVSVNEGNAIVTIPEVLLWKTVVFQFVE